MKPPSAVAWLLLASFASAQTAADLSRPGALQEHVSRPGPVVLPRGVIRYTQTLRLPDHAGKKITGQGAPYIRKKESGWDRINEGTILLYEGPEDEPAVSCRTSHNLLIEDLTLFVPEGKRGIEYYSRRGFPSNHGVLENVSLVVEAEDGVCFYAGSRGVDSNGGDVSFRSVRFTGDYGFVSGKTQNVDYSFTGMCYWYGSKVCIWNVQGGGVYVHGCGSNGVREAILRIGANGYGGGGINTVPFVVSGFRADRSFNRDFTFWLLDAQHAEGLVRGTFDAINVIGGGGEFNEPYQGHTWIRWPEQGDRPHDYVAFGSTALPGGSLQPAPWSVLRKSDSQPDKPVTPAENQ